MNSKTTIIGLVAAIAVLSGAMGMSVTGAFSDQTIAQFAPNNVATGMLMGQVMIEAHNEDGEQIAYRMGDNEVVDGGEQCILKLLFATTGGGGDGDHAVSDTDFGRGQYASSDVCTGILTGAWDVIAIGVGTTGHGDAGIMATAALHDLFSGLETECHAGINVGTNTCLADALLSRGHATTKTWTNGTGGTDTKIVLAKTFTSGTVASITESGLFNSTAVATGGMLSHKTFSAVSLTSGDSITVTWTFTVGN